MKIEIGDRFIINWKIILNLYPKLKACNRPNKEFTIVGFSKSELSVYFIDNRTNKKGCKCQFCISSKNEKCIQIEDIIITVKRVQYDRNKKLTKLLK